MFGLLSFEIIKMRYPLVLAIQIAFSILQIGVIDIENKSELKKLREIMERLEGVPSGIVDI